MKNPFGLLDHHNFCPRDKVKKISIEKWLQANFCLILIFALWRKCHGNFYIYSMLFVLPSSLLRIQNTHIEEEKNNEYASGCVCRCMCVYMVQLEQLLMGNVNKSHTKKWLMLLLPAVVCFPLHAYTHTNIHTCMRQCRRYHCQHRHIERANREHLYEYTRHIQQQTAWSYCLCCSWAKMLCARLQIDYMFADTHCQLLKYQQLQSLTCNHPFFSLSLPSFMHFGASCTLDPHVISSNFMHWIDFISNFVVVKKLSSHGGAKIHDWFFFLPVLPLSS